MKLFGRRILGFWEGVVRRVLGRGFRLVFGFSSMVFAEVSRGCGEKGVYVFIRG